MAAEIFAELALISFSFLRVEQRSELGNTVSVKPEAIFSHLVRKSRIVVLSS